MNVGRDRSDGTNDFVELARLEREDREARERRWIQSEDAHRRREAAERDAQEQKRIERADEILAMTPEQHRRKAAYFLAVAEEAELSRRMYYIGKANVHLGLAAADRSAR